MRWAWRWPRASARRPRRASPWTSAPTARCCWARATGSGPARPRRGPRWGARSFAPARGGEGGAAREILLTQDDVRQVQLCKGAIASGAAMLQRIAGVAPDQVSELMLAGGFGNYLSIPSAPRIGVIPPLPPR